MSYIYLSVAVCTHNPRPRYMSRVIGSLENQTLDPGAWELIVIDNASVTPVEEKATTAWHPHGRLVAEPRLGLVHARLRALAESKAAVVVFVDDDNVLDQDYLERAAEIAATWPQLGVWGGQQRPEYEVPPQPELTPYLPSLGLREISSDLWSNQRCSWETAPYGAGMCVRRQVLDRYAADIEHDPLRSGLGVRGDAVLRCEDIDIAFTSTDMGLGTGLFASLRLTHLIPAERLSEGYLLRLMEGNGYSGTIVGFVHGRAPVALGPLQRTRSALCRYRLNRFDRAMKKAEQQGRITAMDAIAASRVSGSAG